MGINLLRVFGNYAGGVKNDAELLDEYLIHNSIVDTVHVVSLANFDKRQIADNKNRVYHDIPSKDRKTRLRTQYDPYNLISSFRTINNIVEEFKIDLIHNHFPHRPISNAAILIAKLKGIPIVSTYHGGKRWNPSEDLSQKISAFVPRYFSDAKTVISDAGQYLMGNNATVIEVPIDHDDFYVNPDEKRFFHDLASPEEKVIFYPARIVPMKGQLDLVMAVRRLQEQGFSIPYKIVLAGNVENSSYYERLKDAISEAGIDETIIIRKDIHYKDMRSAYNSADLQVFPTYEEGLGKIIVEAGLCGLPTIANEVGGIPSAIHDGYNGILVAPTDIKMLSEKMAFALINDKERIKMGENCITEFSNRYLMDDAGSKFAQIYLECIGNKKLEGGKDFQYFSKLEK